MIDNIKVKVGPQVYRYDEEAIDFIPAMLEEYNAKNILLVHGTVSWEESSKNIISF